MSGGYKQPLRTKGRGRTKLRTKNTGSVGWSRTKAISRGRCGRGSRSHERTLDADIQSVRFVWVGGSPKQRTSTKPSNSAPSWSEKRVNQSGDGGSDRVNMGSLDEDYPKLSELVSTVLGIGLEGLADRAPAQDYEYFDLERLLADARAGRTHIKAGDLLAGFAEQTHGYIATLEAYVGLGVLKDKRQFVKKKLCAPRKPRAAPPGSEMLDTVAECSWGLWLHDRYGNLEEERLLPGSHGNTDFYVSTGPAPLWVDCISIAPESDRFDLNAYLSRVVFDKWKTKFAARGAASLPAAIAVTALKKQEHVVHALHFNQTIGNACVPSDSLWVSCPGLQCAWFATPPWHATAHRPDVFAAWYRPGCSLAPA